MYVRIIVLHAQPKHIDEALEYTTGRVREVVASMNAAHHSVYRGADDSSLIVHVIGFDTKEQLDAYWDSPELADLAKNGYQVWGDETKFHWGAKLELIAGRLSQ